MTLPLPALRCREGAPNTRGRNEQEITTSNERVQGNKQKMNSCASLTKLVGLAAADWGGITTFNISTMGLAVIVSGLPTLTRT
jgi:hypothetical protein